MSKLFERLLEARGIDESFLRSEYENLTNPLDLPDMTKAVERIKKAVQDGERVLIYGDYDVDGVTASTVMEDTLRLAGVKEIEIMLPDRFVDGYGMSSKIIERAKEQKISLVVTVDCGSANKEIIQELNVLGVDTIVTDHHECPKELPEAVAVVNPKRLDYKGFRDLAGVGVAFMVALALVNKGLIRAGQEKWLLDLALIGTICDSMPLVKDNRILGYYGMKVLKKTRRVGLIELMKRAGVKSLNSEAIGFQIGPRLNAAGRLDTANLALGILRTKSQAEAAGLADKLEELNKRRKSEQRMATAEIEQRGVGEEPVIIEVGKWHEGILGIVAGRLVEDYAKPAFVLTEVQGGILKGSGRSFGEFNLAEALEYCRDVIVGGGGHAAAAGVKLERANLWQFREKINEYYKSLGLGPQAHYLKEKADLKISQVGELSLDFVEELKMLEPFGDGNKEPIFLVSGIVLDVRKMGAEGQHLCLNVRGEDGKNMKLVAFFAPEQWFEVEMGEKCEILVRLMENEWNGIRSVEGRIIDIMI